MIFRVFPTLLKNNVAHERPNVCFRLLDSWDIQIESSLKVSYGNSQKVAF